MSGALLEPFLELPKVLSHLTSTVQTVATACNVKFLPSSEAADLKPQIKGVI